MLQRRTAEEESDLIKKELTALREQLVNKSQELEVGGTNFLWQSGLLLSKVSLLRGTTSGLSLGGMNHLEEKEDCSALLNAISVSLCLLLLSPPSLCLTFSCFQLTFPLRTTENT